MLINIPRRQIIGGLLVAVLFAAMIALGLSHPSPADDSSASKASGFSPYVTKDGAISRPTDYRGVTYASRTAGRLIHSVSVHT